LARSSRGAAAVRGDARSRRVAIVPDGVVNAAGGAAGALHALEQEGWGVVALCPPGLVPAARDAWLDAIVEQVVTFLDDEYEVVLVAGEDDEADRFVNALEAAGRTVARRPSLP
jgi:hypothetical protein